MVIFLRIKEGTHFPHPLWITHPRDQRTEGKEGPERWRAPHFEEKELKDCLDPFGGSVSSLVARAPLIASNVVHAATPL